jgi:hypothetical protein
MVELIAVVAVISVVSGFAVVGVNGGAGGSNLDAGARKVANSLVLARSEAISRHTVVRFVVAHDWAGKDDASLRRFSLWAWDADAAQFFPISKWEELATGLIMEPGLPDYVRESEYAESDPAAVRAECVLDVRHAESAAFIQEGDHGSISTRYIEFMPSGNVRIPGGGGRRATYVVTQGYQQPTGELLYTPRGEHGPADWAQVNVDTLTGNVRIYQP